MKILRVSSDNIQELWNCPQVKEIIKTVSGDMTKQTIIIRFEHREYYVPNGWFLVQDNSGSWSAISPQLCNILENALGGLKNPNVD